MVKSQYKDRTREVCSSAPERTKYGDRWSDLIGQLKCGLEVLVIMGVLVDNHMHTHISLLECSFPWPMAHMRFILRTTACMFSRKFR